MKSLAWFSLSCIVLGLLMGAGPYLLLLAVGEESEEGAALGWIFFFFALPVGLLLMTVAVILILIAGSRGLSNGSPRRFGILAIVGAGGSALSALALIVLEFNNLSVAYDEGVSLVPLALITAVLLILGLVAAFALAFNSPTRFADNADSPAGA